MAQKRYRLVLRGAGSAAPQGLPDLFQKNHQRILQTSSQFQIEVYYVCLGKAKRASILDSVAIQSQKQFLRCRCSTKNPRNNT